jgi:hypothetical protein
MKFVMKEFLREHMKSIYFDAFRRSDVLFLCEGYFSILRFSLDKTFPRAKRVQGKSLK